MKSFFEERGWEKSTKERVKKLNDAMSKTPRFKESLKKSKDLFLKNYAPNR